MWKCKILIGVSGSISAFKMVDVVSQLTKLGHQVRVMATESSLRFVGASTWEGLTGTPPLLSSFDTGRQMAHIRWQREADLILYAPITAHTMNSMAAGLGGSPLLDVYLAHDFKKPLLIAPAMNTQMWNHPATTESRRVLDREGIIFIDPEPGALACGEFGEGRLASPQNILAQVLKYLPKPSDAKNILITYGGTQEPIDDVRVLTNVSTGKSGSDLADLLTLQGHNVEVFRAETAPPAKYSLHQKTFTTSRSLAELLAERLKTPLDSWIQMAAVSDFTVSGASARSTGSLTQRKISSDHSDVTLQLRRTDKLIQTLGKQRSEHCALVAFKLTSHASQEEAQAAVQKLCDRAPVDLVVHNDLRDHQNGRPVYTLYSCNGEARGKLQGLDELAQVLPHAAAQALRSPTYSLEESHDLMP
jgi:phosphopantothenoylcysteine decarboxylase/phosphopantothenate--cysteine ligase